MYKIAVVGLGYVGLPIASLFAKKYPVVGFDIDEVRISLLKNGKDTNHEIDEQELKKVLLKEHPFRDHSDSKTPKKGLYCTVQSDELKDCNCFIIAVPTLLTPNQQPNLTQLINASQLVAKYLKKGDLVIYESTVYPGATEEVCVNKLEKVSSLKLNDDFYVGYSPERINTGDKEHTLENVVKITAGSSIEAAKAVDDLYKSVIKSGTCPVSSIRVAETVKIVENSQRDVNIAFVNELSKIMSCLNIDTNEVLKAAETKWNFNKYNPGMVGGSCIGIAPIFLSMEVKKKGYEPLLLDASRKVNNSMSAFIASEVIKLMTNNGLKVKNSEVLILGITFKENCTDARNSKILDLIEELKSYGCKLSVYDPICNAASLDSSHGIELERDITSKKYHAIVAAVAHDVFYNNDYSNSLEVNGVIYDVKGILHGKANKTL
jgi:UDP-N-acetyl-D-galactosamine dehydrogenase